MSTIIKTLLINPIDIKPIDMLGKIIKKIFKNSIFVGGFTGIIVSFILTYIKNNYDYYVDNVTKGNILQLMSEVVYCHKLKSDLLLNCTTGFLIGIISELIKY